MFVGIAKLDLFLPGSHSLKEKRMILKPIEDKTFAKFKIPVHEVGYQDLWQRAQIGFSFVGIDAASVGKKLDDVIGYIESLDLAQVTERTIETADF